MQEDELRKLREEISQVTQSFFEQIAEEKESSNLVSIRADIGTTYRAFAEKLRTLRSS